MFIQANIKRKVWLTSDTHYNHENICKATTNWDDDKISKGHSGYRDFESLDKMNQCLVEGINRYVAKDDVLFHLGDWSFGGIESIFEFRKQIHCKEIHLILGNHDHHIENNKLIPQQDEAINYAYDYLGKDLNTIYMQDLFSSVQNVLQIKVQLHKKQKAIPLFLSHYSHRVWNNHHRGWMHAFGHSHGSLDDSPNGRSIDVGIDTAFKQFNEYRPYSFNEVKELCMLNDIQEIDHHKK